MDNTRQEVIAGGDWREIVPKGALLLTFKSYNGKYEGERINIAPNPTDKTIDNAERIAKNYDYVVAVGGGSVIDTGKAMGKPMLAVPANFSGAEATSFVSYYRDKHKYSIESKLPEKILLEPKHCKNAPKGVLERSVVDALCHALESANSKKATQESRGYSKFALNLIIETTIKTIGEFCINDSAIIKSYLAAGNAAGMAINIANTSLPHALSYPLVAGGMYHGEALAKVVAPVYKYIGKDEGLLYQLFGILGMDYHLNEDIDWLIDEALTYDRAKNFSEEIDRKKLIKCFLS